jgi:hypothetical protein
MKSKEFWIKLSCWVGAVVDAFAALMLMVPALDAWMTGMTAVDGSAMYNVPAATAAALMWGWTILLIWAARKPLERHGVLAITLFPVLSGLAGYRLYGLITTQVDLSRNIPLLIFQLGLIFLFGISLWNFHHSEKQGG